MDSSEDKKDLDVVLELQKTKTEAECKRVTLESDGFATFFGAAYGPLSERKQKTVWNFRKGFLRK